jgi:hypothetical protein
MIGVTLFGLYLTPVFFYVVRRLARGKTPVPVPAEGRDHAAPAAAPAGGDGSLKVTARG